MKAHHLLLIRFSALGDVAITAPVIRCLYKTYPNLKITFVSRPNVAPLFHEFDNFNFFPTDFKGRHKGIKGIWTLFKELKTIPFNATKQNERSAIIKACYAGLESDVKMFS